MVSLSLSTNLQYVIKFVLSFDRLILMSSTGSGKSTLLPSVLADGGKSVWIAMDAHNSIISSIVKYTRKTFSENGEHPEIIHVKEPVDVVRPGTVTYSTRKILAQSLNSIIATLDIVILDDAHIDSLDGLAIVNAIRFYRDVISDIRFPKLILTSAEKVAIPHEGFSVLDLRKEESGYTIDVRYHGTLERDFDVTTVISRYVSSSEFTNGKHFLLFVDDVTKYGKLLNDTFNKDIDDDPRNFKVWKSQQSRKHFISPQNPKNVNILVIRSINRDLASLGNMSTIIVVGSELSNAITIPNVSVVFDLLKKKVHAESIFETELPGSFNQSYITKIEANQRRGRTGRTNDGICYRFSSKRFFDRLLDTPESYPDSKPNLLACARLISYGLNPSIVYDTGLKDMVEELARIGLVELD